MYIRKDAALRSHWVISTTRQPRAGRNRRLENAYVLDPEPNADAGQENAPRQAINEASQEQLLGDSNQVLHGPEENSTSESNDENAVEPPQGLNTFLPDPTTAFNSTLNSDNDDNPDDTDDADVSTLNSDRENALRQVTDGAPQPQLLRDSEFHKNPKKTTP
jgi:hypothetical protein